MTALAMRRRPPREMALFAALLAWAALVSAIRLGFMAGSGSLSTDLAFTYGVPGGLVVAAWLRRGESPALVTSAAVASCVTLALLVPPLVADRPKLGYVLPGALLAGAITQRFPTQSLLAMFAFSGFYGSAEAFLNIPGDRSVVWLVEALWVGVLGSLVLGRRDHRVRVTPVFFLLAGFLVFSVIAMVTTIPSSSGFRALRIAPQYLSVALLIGYGGFSARHLGAFARGMLVVIFAVDAYAALRWAIGPASSEIALQKNYQDYIYNRLPYSDDTKVQGSFPNGNSLGLWLACTTPLLLAAALAWRGWTRTLAFVTLPLAIVALLGSAQRAAAAALVAGLMVVVLIHALSRGHRGPRLGIVVATILAVVVSAGVFYPAVADNSEKQKRYSNLLTPTQDLSVQERLNKWQQTLVTMNDEPFGYGLGSGNPNSVGGFRFADVSSIAIDNSYLVIGYEQGFFVMGLFVVTMLVLLVELLRFAVWTRGPSLAAMSTAAVGTLTAMLVELMAADYLTFPAIMAGWAIVGLGLAAFSLPSDEPSAAHAEP